jgi:hypothetical protein
LKFFGKNEAVDFEAPYEFEIFWEILRINQAL